MAGSARHLRITAAALTGLLSSCSRQADVIEDHSEICKLRCEQVFECDTNHDYASLDECVAECNTPNEGIWRTSECDELAEANLECIAELSCAEYSVYQTEHENFPCQSTTYEISVCLAIHTPEGP
jgi:hypothetical protein